MPCCAVKRCTKYSRMKNKSSNSSISFHKFPREQKTRDKWIVATGQEHWLPPTRATICSVHFEAECFVKKRGHTWLKNGSVPTLHLHNLDPCSDAQNKETNENQKGESSFSPPNDEKVGSIVDSETQSNFNICRICLATDRKMYAIIGDRVHFYEQVTGLTFSSEDLLPKYVCWECRHYMSKYVAFKNRAVRNHCTLLEILDKDGLITKSSVVNFNMYKSTLTCTHTLHLNAEEDNFQSEIGTNNEVNELNDNFINFIDMPEDINNDFNEESIPKDIDNVFKEESIPEDINNDFNEESTPEDIDNDFNEESIPEDISNDFKDESLNNTETDTLIPDDLIGHSANVEATEATNENSNEEIQSTANLPSVERKRKAKSSEISKDKKNSNDKSKISKVTKLVDVGRKEVSTVKEKKDVKSSTDGLDKDLFHITELNIDEQIAALQNRKESKNYKNSKYKCENCFKGFIDIAAYERHMTKHLESSGPHICPLCKTHFKRDRKLKDHMRTHAQKFSCLSCKFSTNYILSARGHQNYHKGKTYECPHCKEVFRHQSSYLGHLRISHPSDIVCKHCGCTFLNERGLKWHILWNHRDDPNQVPADGPACARCDIRFSCQEALDTHRRVSAQHADERNAGFFEPVRNSIASLRNELKRICEKNGKKYSSSEPFPDGPKPCELCAALLSSRRAYFVHFRKAHKQYLHQSRICEVCGKAFRSKETLRTHQFVHQSSKQFKCDRCGKLFQRETSIGIHQKYHCGPRVDFPCSVCGKTLSSKTNLNRHMEIHKGLSYKCEFCGKVFGCRDNKTQHVMFVHNNRPWPRRKRELRKRAARQPEAVVQSAVHETEVNMTEESNSP